MPISDHVRGLRDKVGKDLLLLPGVAAAIHDETGRLLMQRRADGGAWGLPGGAVDPGEAPAQAIVREVWEETGLVVVPQRVIGVFGGNPGLRFEYPNGDLAEYLVVLFACKRVGGTLECRDGESLELRWLAQQDLPALRAGYPPEVLFSTAPDCFFRWEDTWLNTP
jgi:mutator protein MutT